MASQRNSSTHVIGNGTVFQGSGQGRITLGLLVRGLADRFLYRIATHGFDIFILAGMAILLMGSALAMGGEVRLFQATVLLPIVIMTVALVFVIKRDPSRYREKSFYLLRDWVPFVVIVFIYENMHDVAGQVMSFDIAGYLYNFDVLLFGVEPSLWTQKIYSPLLTDVMAFSYALYFFQPLLIMFLLSLWGKRLEFRHMALTLTISFFLGFLGYVFLPCSPPRYFIENVYSDPVRLHGLFLFDWLQGKWDGLSVVSGGAFPSLHVGLSAVALWYAYKYKEMNRTMKMLWYAYVPLVVSLWFSTVYLRHHWVADIFAGFFVAGVAYMASSFLMEVWGTLRRRYHLQF